MDRGTESNAPRGRPEGSVAVAGRPAARRVAPAVAVVGRDRLVSHWSRGAREMFGVPEEEAIGRPATDLLPVSGALPDEDDEPPDPGRRAYGGLGSARALSPDGLRSGPAFSLDGLGPGPEFSLDGLGSGPAFSRGGPLSRPAAGRARLTVPGRDRLDVLWWAYPLVGPGRARLLVLAADAEGLRGDPADGAAAGASRAHGAAWDRWAVERVVPAFAPYTDFPRAGEPARGLPEALPGLSVGESARIVAQVLELGCPVLEFRHGDRVPVVWDPDVRAATGSPR
ncbi:hypothetical protein E0E62_14305 [Streptomyces sp. 16-176A]